MIPKWSRAARSIAGLRSVLRARPSTVRIWLQNARAIEQALGRDESSAYTRLLLAAPSAEVLEAMAAVLPDVLAAVPPAERQRFYRMMRAVLEDNPVAAIAVARTLPRLLVEMDDVGLSGFIATALQMHESDRARAEGFLRMESQSGRQAVEVALGGTTLRSLHRSLTMYARAHCGEAVQVRPGGNRSFTDGRHLYLPDRINRFGDERDQDVYWVETARAAGYIEFGSLDIDLDSVEGPWAHPADDEMPYDRMTRSFQNPVIAATLFLMFERIRVERRVASAYPGVARRIRALKLGLPVPELRSEAPADRALHWIARGLNGEAVEGTDPAFVSARAVLQHAEASEWNTVNDVVHSVVLTVPMVQDLLQASDVTGTAAKGLGFSPESMSEEDKAVEAKAATLLRSMETKSDFESARESVQSTDNEGLSFAEMSEFLDRMEAPGGPLQGGPDEDAEIGVLHRDVDRDIPTSAYRYPEWDHELGEYKTGWVALTEYRLGDGNPEFVDTVLAEHGGMIGTIRRAFEGMRPEASRPKRGLSDGDELDFDAVIAARIASRAGRAADEGLYRARHRSDRDVSVAFLVDMSSSTNEHINTANKRIIDVEREALVVASEAIAALGDPMAIYGFSGFGRDQVAFYVAKEFDEPYGPAIRQRIGAIGWKMENRDGAAIRHATEKLKKAPGAVKLLMLLSDGKPLDCGCTQYSDAYAHEDTRAALTEARAAGVHPFCITVDPHARGYLRRIYGDGGYTIIDSVESLPARLPAIYRRLTR